MADGMSELDLDKRLLDDKTVQSGPWKMNTMLMVSAVICNFERVS